MDNIQGHLLIVLAEQDPNVTPENVYRVTKALDEAGIAFEILSFDGEGHGISKVNNQKKLYLAMLNFFNCAFADQGDA